MWSDMRSGRRVSCNDKCLLVFNGDTYHCELENISISGVLLRCDDMFPADISPGSKCGLLLCSDPVMCPGEYPAMVARLDAPKVGLQFLDFE